MTTATLPRPQWRLLNAIVDTPTAAGGNRTVGLLRWTDAEPKDLIQLAERRLVSIFEPADGEVGKEYLDRFPGHLAVPDQDFRARVTGAGLSWVVSSPANSVLRRLADRGGRGLPYWDVLAGIGGDRSVIETLRDQGLVTVTPADEQGRRVATTRTGRLIAVSH